jgi:hypothetical protein
VLFEQPREVMKYLEIPGAPPASLPTSARRKTRMFMRAFCAPADHPERDGGEHKSINQSILAMAIKADHV